MKWLVGVMVVLIHLPCAFSLLIVNDTFLGFSDWDINIVDDSFSVINTGLAPYSKYYLRVRVNANGEINQLTTESMISFGEIPALLFVVASPITVLNTTSRIGTNYGWYIGFESQDEGVVQIMVYGKFSLFFGSDITNTTFTFNVNPFRQKVADGLYTNLIGEVYTNATTPFPSVSITTFYVPSLSQTALGHFVVINPDSNYIAYSDSNFRSIEIIHPEIEKFPIVCTGATAGIKAGYLNYDRVLLSTVYGILFGELNAQGAITWKVNLAQCINSLTVLPLFYSFGQDLVTESLQYSFAFGSSLGLWISIHPLESSFSVIVDDKGQSLAAYINNLHGISQTPAEWQVIQAAANDVFATTYLFLLNCTGSSLFPSGSVLISFTNNKQDSNCCGGKWATVFVFPSHLPDIADPSSSFLDILWSNSVNSGADLYIDGMIFQRGGDTPDLFFWGSALLYSPDNGNTIFILKNFTAPERITSFVSSFDGSYVFLTSTNQLYFGQILSQTVVPIFVPELSSSARKLFFDATNDLYALTVTLNTQLSTDSISLDTTLLNSVADTIQLLSDLSKLQCPYETMVFGFNNDPTFSRSVLPLSASGYPPAVIFVDYLVNYTFTLTLTSNIPLYEIAVSFRFPQTEFLDFEFERVDNYSSSLILYTVTVQDLGHFGEQKSPGEDLQPSPLQIRVSDTNLDCGNSITQSVLFYTGCPPGHIFSFNDAASRQADEGCKDINGIPCVFFGNKFHPVFEVVDTFTSTSTLYDGLFSFTIIGGGETEKSMKNFTKSEIEDYNSGSDTIWVPVHDLHEGGGMDSSTGVFWLCTRGSPCGNLFPKYPNTPEYFLLIRATTLNANESYCAYTTDFVLRLHTINLSIGIYILVFFVTLIALALGFAATYYFVIKYKNVWLLGFRVDKR